MKSMPTVFNIYSHYYDLLYRDKDYSGEADYIQGLLIQQGIVHGKLLEFGSGTGKHGRLLAARGYHIHGIEKSEEMVARATSVDRFSCEQGDICTTHLGKTFDAVLSLFHVVSYQVSNSDLQATFMRAAEHLNPGGIFIFDFWYTPAVYSQRPSIKVKRIADEKLEIIRLAEPLMYCNTSRVDVNYTIFARDISTGVMQTITETHPMRHFSLQEIDLLSEASGFERIGAEEFLTGKPAGEDTWGLCVVLRKM